VNWRKGHFVLDVWKSTFLSFLNLPKFNRIGNWNNLEEKIKTSKTKFLFQTYAYTNANWNSRRVNGAKHRSGRKLGARVYILIALCNVTWRDITIYREQSLKGTFVENESHVFNNLIVCLGTCKHCSSKIPYRTYLLLSISFISAKFLSHNKMRFNMQADFYHEIGLLLLFKRFTVLFYINF
jgi:hypothetical protein